MGGSANTISGIEIGLPPSVHCFKEGCSFFSEAAAVTTAYVVLVYVFVKKEVTLPQFENCKGKHNDDEVSY